MKNDEVLVVEEGWRATKESRRAFRS